MIHENEWNIEAIHEFLIFIRGWQPVILTSNPVVRVTPVMPLVDDATGNDLTYRIIGAAMSIHNALGPGYKEEVYEKALIAQLRQEGSFVQDQYPVEVWHAETLVAIFYLDLFVEEQVVVEIKAFSHQLTNDELAQVINYLKATEAPVGLLFNFGRRRLEYRRVFPSIAKDEPIQRTGRDNVLKSGLK